MRGQAVGVAANVAQRVAPEQADDERRGKRVSRANGIDNFQGIDTWMIGAFGGGQ